MGFDPHFHTMYHLIWILGDRQTPLLMNYSQSHSTRMRHSYREHCEIDVWWQNFVSSLECYFAQQREKKVQGQANTFTSSKL